MNSIELALPSVVKKWVYKASEQQNMSVQAFIRKKLRDEMTKEMSKNEARKKL
ncbi:hypothetical protein [Vibrio campbellii]|uniref:hypothetical protein n=1 Tax=Vibrio campbellii TaxID=680 RepID=UPI003F86DB83